MVLVGYIRIWATPPRRLVFWDGAPSPYKYPFLGNNLYALIPIVVISGEDAPRPDRLGWRSENELQDLLRQCEEEKKKIFQSK